MDTGRRTSLSFALILVALGAWFLAVELSPAVREFAYGRASWPWNVVGAGGLMLLAGLLTWTPGWAIPACIVGGIGGLLYWQNLTGEWGSWAWAWTLIPGFVGVGLILAGLLLANREAAGAGQAHVQPVEEGFAHAVRTRADLPGGHRESSPAPAAPDDAHAAGAASGRSGAALHGGLVRWPTVICTRRSGSIRRRIAAMAWALVTAWTFCV